MAGLMTAAEVDAWRAYEKGIVEIRALTGRSEDRAKRQFRLYSSLARRSLVFSALEYHNLWKRRFCEGAPLRPDPRHR